MATDPPGYGSTETRRRKSASHGLASKGTTEDTTVTTIDCNAQNERLSSHDSKDTHFIVSVVTYNCEGLMSAVSYVVDLLLSNDVVFLAETWMSRSEECFLNYLNSSCPFDSFLVQNFAMDFPPRAGEGRRHDGVAMICRNRTGFRYDTIECGDSRLCGVTMSDSLGSRLNVLGCYMPYWNSADSSIDEFSHLVSKLDALYTALSVSAPTALIGDFNCALPRMNIHQRPTHWYQLRGFSQFSAIMQEFLDEQDLFVAEFRFPQPVSFTYERGSCRTHIDHIVIPSSISESVITCGIEPQSADNLSPHLPVGAKLRFLLRDKEPSHCAISSSNVVVARPYILNWSCSHRIELYNAALELRLSHARTSISEESDVNELDACITDCIHAAAMESGCAKRWRPPKFWWNPTVTYARDKARFWFKLWKDCGRQVNSVVHVCYGEARRAYRRARKLAAHATVDREARLLHSLRSHRNINAFWRRVNSARRCGQRAHTDLSADDFAAHFGSVSQGVDCQLSPAQQLICDAVAARFSAGCDLSEPHSVSPEDVSILLRRLKRGTAPGVDHVTVEHLLYGESRTLLAAVARLLTGCFATLSVPDTFSTSVITPVLKKNGLNANNLDNYRPIALITTMSKLLECLLLSELTESFSPNELQFGFVENRGTPQASLLVTETAQWHLRRGSPVFAANLDARKCFDRIWHDGLFFHLISLLSSRSWHLLVMWYRHLNAFVNYAGHRSNNFVIKRGTRQGAILSPALANVFFKPLLSLLDATKFGAHIFGHHVPAVCYADDLMLLSTNAKYLGLLLKVVENYATFWRLDFVHTNPTKTKSHCIVFGADLLSELPVWHLSGQQLAVRSVTEHLGVVVPSDTSGSPHVQHRIRRARGSFYGLTPVGILSESLSPLDKAYLWNTVVLPALTFGCEVVPISSADVDALESLQSRCIKAALGLSKYAHHSALMRALGIPRIHEELRRAVLFGLAGIFRCDRHRLSQIMTSGLAMLATDPQQLYGTFLGLAYKLNNCRFESVLENSLGHVDPSVVRGPIASDGTIDSLRFLLNLKQTAATRQLIRLMCS